MDFTTNNSNLYQSQRGSFLNRSPFSFSSAIGPVRFTGTATTTPPSKSEDSADEIPLEIRIFDQSEVEEFTCGICASIFKQVYQCKNGHLFCASCSLEISEKKQECPYCRASMTKQELSRNRFVENSLQKVRVHCKYHYIEASTSEQESNLTASMHHLLKDKWIPDPSGCPEILILQAVKNHEDDCQYAPVICKYSRKCHVRQKELVDHHQDCPYRPQDCEYCGEAFDSHLMASHVTQCNMFPIQCSNCDLHLKRGDLVTHRDKDCPEQMIKCKFEAEGCTQMMLRKDLNDHISQNSSNHLGLISNSFYSQVEALKKQFETQLKLRDDRIRNLERALSEKEVKVEWSLNNWSRIILKKAYHQSEKFMMEDANWFFGLYTDGDNEESRGFLSIYLFLDQPMPMRGKNVTVEFTIKFVNHKDPRESVSKVFKTSFPIKAGQGWGDRKAIETRYLTEDAGFLKNDSLTIETSLVPSKITWTISNAVLN